MYCREHIFGANRLIFTFIDVLALFIGEYEATLKTPACLIHISLLRFSFPWEYKYTFGSVKGLKTPGMYIFKIPLYV
jgi:hypothetical protein